MMESLSDDLVLLLSLFVDDPADLARFGSTCRRAHRLCNPLAVILSNETYALRQRLFIEPLEEGNDDNNDRHHHHHRRQQYQQSMLTTSDLTFPRGKFNIFVYHAESCRRAYLGRFKRTRVFIENDNDRDAHAEVHHGLAFKVGGQAEEHWTIDVSGLLGGGDCETLGVAGAVYCFGTERDCRGWVKARGITCDTEGKPIEIDALGKLFVSRKGVKQKEDKGSTLLRLTPISLYTENPMEALNIPIIPNPLFSYAGKITIFEPTSHEKFDFWNRLPPNSNMQVVLEFDCALLDGIYTVRARAIEFGVSIPVLVEDSLGDLDDYRYFLLHLFRRNSGRWETLLTYFAHAARSVLHRNQRPAGVQAASRWPTEHRDHTYEIRGNNLYINVRDGLIDSQAPTLYPEEDPWRLFLCDV